jgi:uncharacterized membrane protein (TIGR02234 family)
VTGQRDAWFAPTVLVGLATAALTAIAATRDWARASTDAAGIPVHASVTGADAAPLAAALGLVALASWGVVLVLRGQARRAVATVGLLAALGVVGSVVAAFDGAQDAAVEAALAQAGTRQAADAATTALTGWYYVTGIVALVQAGCLAVAWVRSPRWPAMGSRYDAPAGRDSRRAAPAVPTSQEEMWRALDEGRDPTS